MKGKLILLIALVIGALAGSWIKNLPGFVIIAYDTTTYQTRLWIAICLILLVLTTLFLLGAFLRSIFKGTNKIKSWHGSRHGKKARQNTINGMLAFSEARWKVAEDAMIKASKDSDVKLINYLIAAQAAQKQNAEVRRDAYLRNAYKAEPAAKTAIGLTQAQLQLENNQLEQALASLHELKNKEATHPFVLQLLCKTYQKLEDWTQLFALLPSLKKQKVFSIEKLKIIECDVISGLMKQAANTEKFEGVRDYWLKLPTVYQKNHLNIIAYVRQVLIYNEFDEAEKLLKPLFKKTPDTEIIQLYGDTKSSYPEKQLTFLEAWQKTQNNNSSEVYLALGKLAYYAKLWGKAKKFLEQSLQVKESSEAFWFMAKTLEELNDEQHAEECYRLGLEFSTNQQHLTNDLKRANLALTSNNNVSTGHLLPKFEKTN